MKPQEAQTEPASVCPLIQNQFWNQPGGEKTLKNEKTQLENEQFQGKNTAETKWRM